MSPDELLIIVRAVLQELVDPVLYLKGREKTFQAALFAGINARLPADIDDLVLEPEVTKSLKRHGVARRPDLILHRPFDLGRTTSRTIGNLVTFELKVAARPKTACADYEKLARMCEKLNYELGVFINIDASDAHWTVYDGPHKDRLKGFAVRLVDGAVVTNEQP